MISLVEARRDPNLFGAAFPGDSWATWDVVAKAIDRLPLTAEELTIYQTLTGRSTAASTPASEVWVQAGRRSGETSIAAALLVAKAVFVDWRPYLGPGEIAVAMLLAPDREQAAVVFQRARALLLDTPLLRPLVGAVRTDDIELPERRVRIAVHTANYRALRGFSVCTAVLDECAFFRDEGSANPDAEVLAALRPALASLPGSLLFCISSPWRRTGELCRAFQRHHAQEGDPVLFFKGATRTFNASFSERVIQREFERDAVRARTEWDAEPRGDLESYLAVDVLDGLVVPGRTELPASTLWHYHVFADPAGSGSQHGDSFTAAVAHIERDRKRVVVDKIVEVRPPFNPSAVAEQMAFLARAYGTSRVTGDRYSAGFNVAGFRKGGVFYQPSERTKSEIYAECLPLFTSAMVELPDHPKLLSQLAGLERTTTRGSGREVIDHHRGGRDDVANAVCGAILLASERRVMRVADVVWG